jgi:glycerol-3-phosphate dehydrogenase
MRRDLSQLSEATFDLLVVGAGIHGACIAWDATLRGLRVALIDRDDFGAGTSANSLGIVHGGLRYLARGDIPRAWESIVERTALLRIAPDLVTLLPVLVPTTGRGPRGRTAHRAALMLNDLVSLARNRGLSGATRIPAGRVLSRRACIDLVPGLESVANLTGGALWYDGRLLHPERLTLSFVRSAALRGAAVANYLRMDRVNLQAGRVKGVDVTDGLSGKEFTIQARMVIIAAGPSTGELVAGAIGGGGRHGTSQALAVNVVLKRRLAETGIGVQAQSSRQQDPVCGGRRFLFLAPQGRASALGTWYAVDQGGDPHELARTGARILVGEWNAACPGIPIERGDILRCQWGRLPLKAGLEAGRADALAERPRVRDHRGEGAHGLISVEGMKYTTARRVARQAIDLAFRSLGRPSPRCRTGEVPLDTGGSPSDISRAVREEMAIRLTDVIFRRTDLGLAPGPDRASTVAAAQRAGAELGWDARRQESEVEDVMRQAGAPNVLEPVG